jgi:hypothetical protein
VQVAADDERDVRPDELSDCRAGVAFRVVLADGFHRPVEKEVDAVEGKRALDGVQQPAS